MAEGMQVYCVVKLGDSYRYTIPGFSVVTVRLRHARVQNVSDGEVKLFDVFFNDEMISEISPPTAIEVIESCYVQADEFAVQVQVPDIRLLNSAILIIWKYKLLHNSESENEFEDDYNESSSAESTADSHSENLTSCVPHTVVFKCIGATKEAESQAALCNARERMSNGWTIPVRMRPEPTNIEYPGPECDHMDFIENVTYYITNFLPFSIKFTLKHDCLRIVCRHKCNQKWTMGPQSEIVSVILTML